jgi:PAS domain S-box-containing protein
MAVKRHDMGESVAHELPATGGPGEIPDAESDFADPAPGDLRDLLGMAPAAIAFMSGAGHIWTYVNDFFVRMMGRADAGDFIGKSIWESLPELASPQSRDFLDQLYRSGQPYMRRDAKIELDRSGSGQPSEGYFDFILRPIRKNKSKLEGILVHVVEVTDRIVAQQVIEANSERLCLAQAAAQIGTWEWNARNNTSTLSPELHHIFGTDAADPDYAQAWAMRVHSDDRSRVFREMEEGLGNGSMEFEYRYLHPQNGLRWFYCKGRKLRDEAHMFGIVQDITSRKATQDASQRLAAIVESSDDAIISKDLHGIVTSWNRCAERMFGYSAEEMIGRPITTIIPAELHDDETRILSTIARGERIEHFETVRLRKAGEMIEVSLTVSPVKDESGRIVGAAKIARDITQRKKVEQALRTSERLASVGKLAATVAHEINNPLESVVNLIYLAKLSADLGEAKRFLALAEEELERVSHLTRQTLGFYRESKSMTQLQIGALLKSLEAIFASRVRNKNIRIASEVNEELGQCEVPGEIRQVIANLVSNSIDAVEPGGEIRIRASQSFDWKSNRRGMRLTVADSGEGIPNSSKNQLFEPFFTTKKGVGTGLGLWVCKSIVQNHQGSIQMRSSTAPGKLGTVFSVFLPIESRPAAPLKASGSVTSEVSLPEAAESNSIPAN